MLRQYGWKNRISYEPGIVSRMDEIQAAILNIKIKSFKKNFALRQKIANMYLTKINNPLIQLPEIAKDTLHAFHLFVVRVANRNMFRKYLKEHGIETMVHYPIPLHLQKAYKNRLPIYFSYKSTENIMNNIVSIPIYPNLSPIKIKYIPAIVPANPLRAKPDRNLILFCCRTASRLGNRLIFFTAVTNL